jgi:hypothetical protein
VLSEFGGDPDFLGNIMRGDRMLRQQNANNFRIFQRAGDFFRPARGRVNAGRVHPDRVSGRAQRIAKRMGALAVG